jgi:NADPH2:quinone reductase
VNAAVVQSFDAPPRFTTFEDPVPQENELLVQVTAAGLHPIVRALANGTHYGSTGKLPFVAGVDGTGRLSDGRRIFFGSSRPPFGTFAERAVTSAFFSLPLPDGLDDTVAAAIGNPGMSSWAALQFRAKIVRGESVLILGATGSAGRLAVQIARRLGASRVVACGRNPKALGQLVSLGADAVISLEQDPEALVAALRSEIAEHGVNIVLDYLWGTPAEAALAAIAQKGFSHQVPRIRYVQIGEIAGRTISLPASTLRSSGLEILGSGFGSVSMKELFEAVAQFFSEAASRPFDAPIRTARLSEIESLWNSADSARIVFQP